MSVLLICIVLAAVGFVIYKRRLEWEKSRNNEGEFDFAYAASASTIQLKYSIILLVDYAAEPISFNCSDDF